MALHFSQAEMQKRVLAACASMVARELDGLLIFRQESMYYLTGYDTFGYCFFQCLYLSVRGDLALLTRAPDIRQAQVTSNIPDIRVWTDRQGHDPASELIGFLSDFDCAGKTIGIELNAYGLTAQIWDQIRPGLQAYCSIVDASELINALRVVKSDEELDFVVRASNLADDALDAAIQNAKPGVFEGDILASMHSAIYQGGGDDPANEFIIGSGENALLCRYHTGRRHLSASDQLTLEFAGVYRHYHACLMRTIVVGQPNERQKQMHMACCEALESCENALKPGVAVGDVFDVHAQVMDDYGFRDNRMNACGYSLGATFAPTWMDWPMFYTANTVAVEPNMVYFLHMILFDSGMQLAMTLGHTVIVGDSGLQRLSRHGMDLIIV